GEESINQNEPTWYRRGCIVSNHNSQFETRLVDKFYPDAFYKIDKVFAVENHFVSEAFINMQFLNKNAINKPSDNDTNKLYNLKLAQTVGLNIPKTIVSN